MQTSVVCQTALRAKMLDDRVRDFVARHPDAVVVDLGAGLDSGFYRVASAADRWTGTASTCPGSPRCATRSCQQTRSRIRCRCRWPTSTGPTPSRRDRPTMLIADGLFAFLSEPVIVGIFRRITEHFGSGELAFNDYGGIGWVSRAAIKFYPQKMFKDVGSQWGYAGFKDAHHPQTWNPRMRAGRGGQPHRTRPRSTSSRRWLRVATKLMGKTKAGARKARILRYAF